MSDFFHLIINLILHLKPTLDELVITYDTWTFLIIFCIVFCETGLVITPFLPGDSLLFAAGAIAAGGALSLPVLLIVLLCASFGGDNSNYFIGRILGPKVFVNDYKLLKKEYLNKTHAFYEKHGGITIIIARFIPIIRTFAPFVAGVGTMNYFKFISFSIIGNCLWILICVFSGYFFGNIPFVQKNFELVVVGIILVSLMPPVIGVIRHKLINR
ncbi:MAG: DedA family protein [Bacteroidota bacterium]|nr:DedA family protein [Bacteroidota bacterium]